MAERPPGSDADDSADTSKPSRRKLTMAEVFGDVLPETTSDERGDDDGGAAERRSEAWLKSQVPPHHG